MYTGMKNVREEIGLEVENDGKRLKYDNRIGGSP